MYGYDWRLIEGFMLAFLRTGTALVLMPVFGYRAVPVQVKAALAFILALVLAPTAAGFVSAGPVGVIPLATAAIGEIMIGLLFGLVTTLFLVGAEFAGSIVGLQMGFGIVNVIDPTFGRQISIIGRIEYLVALIILLALDVHHHFIAVLAQSFQLIPLGGALFEPEMVISYGQLTAYVFVVAIKLAAPIMAMLLLTEMALGFVARTMPQMNVFIVGFPLKIGIGLIGLAVTWPLFVYVLSKVFLRFESALTALVRQAAGL